MQSESLADNLQRNPNEKKAIGRNHPIHKGPAQPGFGRSLAAMFLRNRSGIYLTDFSKTCLLF